MLITNQTLQIIQIDSMNEYGDTTTTLKTIKCRVQFKIQLIINQDGQEVTSMMKIFTHQIVRLNDFAVYEDKEYRILRVDKIVDLFGDFSHLEVYV